MLKKLPNEITANPKKVILQFFELNETRTRRIINFVLSLPKNNVKKNLENVFIEFSSRHRHFEEIILSHYKKIEKYIHPDTVPNLEQKLLLGSYFSKEYSISSAALFNPSIVVHPDQSDAENGSLKFVMSMRATGEGHISSIVFEEGIVDKNGSITLKEKTNYSCLPVKTLLTSKDLKAEKKIYKDQSLIDDEELTSSNYKCKFNSKTPLNERVLFPSSPSEIVGMEDVRLVRLVEGQNKVKYIGTYTAYNGRTFRTQFIETEDFSEFSIRRLYGKAINDKGMALFPRKIKNKFVMTSRQDGENLFLMYSDNLYHWDEAEIIKTPQNAWDLIQLGNCGSPIETDDGWLLITHAVGPVRKYVVSALLLDLDDPSKIIGSLSEPLIQPNKQEREGYVPNVVYSCGSIMHKKYLIIPYAFSDSGCRFAKIQIKKLLQRLKNFN